MTHKRQGDLLFVRIEQTTKAKEHTDGRVLARGEVTGHAHAIAPEDLVGCDVFFDEAGRFIVEVKPERKVRVAHEDHGRVELEAGTWEVRRQREYEPEGWRQVAD